MFLINKGFKCTIVDNSSNDIVSAMKYKKDKTGKFSNHEISRIAEIYGEKKKKEEQKEELVDRRINVLLSKIGQSKYSNMDVLKNEFSNSNSMSMNALLCLLCREKYDEEKGFHTCSYLGRIARTDDEMSDEEFRKAIEQAIDEILKYDFMNIYKKVRKPISKVEGFE